MHVREAMPIKIGFGDKRQDAEKNHDLLSERVQVTFTGSHEVTFMT